MIHSLRKAGLKHGYLFIAAAWLFTISFIFSNYWTYDASPRKVQNKIEQQIQDREKQVNQIIDDTALLHSLLIDTISSPQKNALASKSFGLFAYSFNDIGNPILTYWNSNRLAVEEPDLKKKDGEYFVNYQNGQFVLVKKTIKNSAQHLLVVALIPVRWEYFIENKYLKSGFDGFPSLEEQYEIGNGITSLSIFGLNGTELFSIHQIEGKAYTEYDWVTIILRTLAALLLLFFINGLATEIVHEKGFTKGYLFLLASVFLLRFITYFIPFPFRFNELGLFDPTVYASNALHPSLGDLLINISLFFWLVNFYKTASVQQRLFKFSFPAKYVAYAQIVLLVFTCFIFSGIIRSLVLDSKISFDVTNFFSLNIYSVTSFVVLCLIMLSFFYVAHILLRLVFEEQITLQVQSLIVAITGLFFLSFNIGKPSTIPSIAVLLWLVIFIVLLNKRREDIGIPVLKSSFFIFWVMFFALSVAGIVLYENRVVELEQRKHIAEKLSQQADPSGESLLNIAITNVDQDFLRKNFYRFESEYSCKSLKDSLISANFSGYLNKYDTRIYTFDSLYHPLFNDDVQSYASIKTVILRQAKPVASVPDLYSYESSNSRINYLFEKAVLDDTGEPVGYFFILAKPRHYVSEALYPELFKQVQDIAVDLHTDYAYAVYNNGRLINSFNDYSFPVQLVKKQTVYADYEEVKKGSYSELWYNAGNNKQVVIAKKSGWVLEFITLFAYLFCSFLLIILLFYAINLMVHHRFKWKNILQILPLNIRAQINLTIIFISVFSFIIIGIATISFFITKFNENKEERLSRSIQVVSAEIENKVRSQVSFDDGLTESDIASGADFERKISEISETNNVDINFYDLNGNLKVSTQPYIYNKHLLSSKMHPLAYDALHNMLKTKYVQNEDIGKLSFLSIYIPLSDDSGRTYAYLNIPYLNSQAELNQEISGFLATLINLNAFIFLIAGAIAYMVTSRITASFGLISNKMKELNLGKVNEAIVWERNDEIGVLVNEYNKMVKKLEESAKALARSEREGAWREMARQVAHEIKNPLTPMKLSIQYLQKAIDSGSNNVKELSQQVATTLVEQIDQLSKIAGDFSQFANIGNVKEEKIELNTLIESLISLYRADSRVEISFQKQVGEVFIMADKIQINRLFTNLIKNAIEASENNAQSTIKLNQTMSDGTVTISVTDNGSGIPDDLQQRIFTPNFTTKSSGTGLGLAICKGIVEKANGHIRFETKHNEGTVFYVSLPIIA
ncbi:MAG: GHKL domain-containing protein [Bacteroidota bacterium]|nr:GHKL domain-containing protein [Bacteroidota bacterium]